MTRTVQLSRKPVATQARLRAERDAFFFYIAGCLLTLMSGGAAFAVANMAGHGLSDSEASAVLVLLSLSVGSAAFAVASFGAGLATFAFSGR